MSHAFRTVIPLPKLPFTISHRDRLMTIGSCFSEHIGRYFAQYRYDTDINPFGQQYNPGSIARAIDRLLSAQPYGPDELILQDERYHSYDHHGSFSLSGKEQTTAGINERLHASSEKIKQVSVLFLTFGTAHVFKLKGTDRIVSNCHKIPAKEFDFEMLSTEEIVHLLSQSLDALWQVNPTVKVVLTVSPVRYFAFGHFENSVSKGRLHDAICQLCQKYAQCVYFPAYEIVMDELRDYRFFADDMLHPNRLAIGYVWEQLVKTFIPAKDQELLREIDDITAAVNHRVRHPDSEAHQKFKEKYLAKMKALEEKYGFDFRSEKSKISR
ncbi:MAG: GSCFA domain-containing protein [Bacteroidetes bacterium]|nr:GSCFA domain-containing protein [Bacteroidota bacterium]